MDNNIIGMQVKYNHLSIPPQTIKLNIIYTIGYDDNYYLIDNHKNKTYLSLSTIKELFVPIDGTWVTINTFEVSPVVTLNDTSSKKDKSKKQKLR